VLDAARECNAEGSGSVNGDTTIDSTMDSTTETLLDVAGNDALAFCG